MTAPQYPFPGWGNRQLRVGLIAFWLAWFR